MITYRYTVQKSYGFSAVGANIDTLLISVQRGINHYIDTIAESLGFYGTLLAALMNNAENVKVTVN